MNFMNLPNIISASRFGMAGVGAMTLLLLPPTMGYPIALGIFILAAFSDWLDGMLARKLGRLSPLGAFMDPLADKVIIYMYFVYLTHQGLYPVWLLMAFLARDLMHDAYRAFAASTRVSMPANIWSKAKTALQMTAIIGSLVAAWWGTMQLAHAAFALMLIAFISGLAGAIQTIREHRNIFSLGE